MLDRVARPVDRVRRASDPDGTRRASAPRPTTVRGWRARAPGSDGPRHGGALVCDEMIIFKVDEDQDV